MICLRSLRSVLFQLFVFTIVGACAQSVFAKESAEFADKVAREHGLNAQQAAAVKAALTSSSELTRNIGDENPATFAGPNHSWHPATRAQCLQKVINTGLIAPNPRFEKICGAKWMSPVPTGPGQPIENAKTCIDQFEFPDIPCEYPVVWITAPTQERICEAMGKRVCNADEWEGGCAGSLDSSDTYFFGLALDAARAEHNRKRDVEWAFQFLPNLKNLRDTRVTCGVFSATDPEISEPMRSNISRYYADGGKSAGCDAGTNPFATCGTNSWPAGFKNNCRSSLDVYDMHGNVAESVNLPTSASEIARGQTPPGGRTEHKGSFFVYRSQYPDDCRVRQPLEHANPFRSNGMAFYQEGFRCCKDTR